MSNQIQGFQLSSQQKRLWLLQQDSQIYRAQCAVIVEGNLQLEILESALQKVIDRNEILRTKFVRTWGMKIPLQAIVKHDDFFINYQILEQKNALEKEINTLFQQSFKESCDYEKEPFLHISLLKFSAQKHFLIISLPALCADTVTLNQLVREISYCYTACLQGGELTDEILQYADIAAWQNELLEAENKEVGRKYWQQPDVSVLKNFQLFNENRLVGKQEFQPQFLTLPIHPELNEQIEAIARQYQVPVNVLFLSCWVVLLWRLTGYSEPFVGVEFDGRNYDELKTALGLLAKYLPLTCHLAAECRFSEILTQINHTTSELAQWQESFVWEPTQERELSFFPFCYEFVEAPTTFSTVNINLTIYKHYVCFDRFQVKLTCFHTPDGAMNAEFHYDASLYAQKDIQRLTSQFEMLLTSVVRNPDATISRLDILSELERSQLLVKFNNTDTTTSQHQCIHHWFEEQCKHTPDNIAVVCGEEQLSYQELNTRANQLAHYWQKLGVGPEVLVGICVERSLSMAIAILSILKAGGAYVPIDLSYPPERKAYILADTQMPLLLTQDYLAADIPTDQIKIVCWDSAQDIIDQQPKTNPLSTTTALNLAYVIYTSGSTGKPKGTLIPHQGLVNYLHWCTQAYQVEQGSGTLVHSSLAFDLTITSLFSPLLVGSQVELLPENQGVEALYTTLRQKNNLSLIKITPAHLQLLSQQLSPSEAASHTRALIIGGENLTAQHIAFWQDFAPDTILVNEYGPTETVVGCCVYQVPPKQNHSGSIPIGYPIANTQLYVLDRHLQPVPTGVAGELYIGGQGVARGYLNHPELSALKFIPHPFSNKGGERLYKTGDRVRFRLDGSLEFLGRFDDQVKIRGFRLELGEIKSVLSLHSMVKDSVVLVREDIPNDQRLVAYIVCNQESSFSVGNLRSFLKEQLPDYMVPSAFVLLKSLPLTSNGKVDRKALPAPDKVRTELEFFVAPRNSTEEKLVEIWAELLRLERVGIHDNFFDLGGHSLLVTQLISRLRDNFEVELLVQQVFAAPTVADLAVIVTQKLVEQIDDEMLTQTLAELEQLSDTETQVVLANSQFIKEQKSHE